MISLITRLFYTGIASEVTNDHQVGSNSICTRSCWCNTINIVKGK